ncbi:MAG TPA: hypothetical protein VKU00_06280 [Chthonomonadaceae bacterium]|nr:hypothetical protein [Chthonomonadaceae bacterium]
MAEMRDAELPSGSDITIRAGWESERDTERSKVTVRWFAIALLFAAILWVRHEDPDVHLSNRVLLALVGGALAMTALEAFYLWRPGRTTIPPFLKYLTVFGDMTFITVLLFYTGYARSPFFFVYFVFLISNCLRYGLLMSLYVAALFNGMYVLVLARAPAGEASVLGGEGVKIVAFWAVALYGGAISARLRRQANQLRVYEETIAELRARLISHSPAETGVEGRSESNPSEVQAVASEEPE